MMNFSILHKYTHAAIVHSVIVRSIIMMLCILTLFVEEDIVIFY